MGVEIRKFADGDLGKVLELCRFARDFHIKMLDGYFCPQDDEQEQKKYITSLDNDKILAYVAVVENQIVGLILAEDKDVSYLTIGRIVKIENFVVDEKFQNQGIGKALLGVVRKYCQENDIKEIKLEVFNANHKAIAFYEKCSFSFIKQELSFFVE